MYHFKPKYTKGLEIGLEASKTKLKIILDQTLCSRANRTEEIIFIRS